MSDYICRTRVQKAAEAAYAALIADHARADRLYNKLKQTQGGTIVSTDHARWLDPLYARNPGKGKPRDLAPSWNHAWKYAQDRLEREIAHRGRRKVIRFMSGGWGAGKTHALEGTRGKATQADLVWDGTLADLKWARETILTALDHGWRVHVFHVHRNVELALYGAIERGAEEGRSVPLAGLPGNHRQVQSAACRLFSKLCRHPEVDFTFVHNTGTKDVPGNALIVEDKDLVFRGALHYTSQYESYHAQAAENIHPAR